MDLSNEKTKELDSIKNAQKKAAQQAWYAKNKVSQLLKKKQYLIDHRERIAIRRKRHYEQNKEKMRNVAKIRYAANKDLWIKWRNENRDRVRAANRRYLHNLKINNPKKFQLTAITRSLNRRARTLNAPGKVSRELRNALMVAQEFKCVYCACDLRVTKSHMDHIIPISRGGTNFDSNFQLTCPKCNRIKGAKHPLDFAAEIGMTKNPLLIAI